MKTASALPAILLVLAWATGVSAADAPARRPNVIFILTDDQGWGDAHFAGHPYVKTPHLDRLAREGTWFRQFYVAATVCSPSRAAFMTSHYPARHQIHGHFATDESNAARSMPNWLNPDVTTLPDILKTVGYATAHFGKWHLGGGKGAPAPDQYGFDESKTVNSSGPSLGDEGKTPFFRAESTRLIVDETIDFMRRHKAEPFYANVWTLLPHAALKPTPEQLAVYAALEPKADDPAFGPWMRKYLGDAEDLRGQMQVFCASLTDLDTQIGRLLDALDELGLADDTIIVLSSDNGPEDYRIKNASNAGVGSTGPLRARKRSMYEGGIRTFGLVRWPGASTNRAWSGPLTSCRRSRRWPGLTCPQASQPTARISAACGVARWPRGRSRCTGSGSSACRERRTAICRRRSPSATGGGSCSSITTAADRSSTTFPPTRANPATSPPITPTW
jgi:arylsulfatase A-like enzyme